MAHGRRNGNSIIAAVMFGLAALVTFPDDAARAASPSAASAPTDVSAQQQNPPRRPTRITVVPLSRYYRKCDFWLAVEHRPSGDVITPQQHCVWALR
jgi:hypothetical protein